MSRRLRTPRSLRRGLTLALVGALALVAGTAQASVAERASGSAQAGVAPLRPTILREPGRTLLARAKVGVWGGAVTASTGETVRVFASDAYAGDTSFTQARAEEIVSLPHGAELSTLTAYFLTFLEMQSVCGRDALACYSPRDQTLISLGENAPDGTLALSILAHEYGHHIARNRLNPPWTALDWGPKRWATSIGICPRERAGAVFPGDPERYELDPAEGFAEAYRVLTEVRAGKSPQWEIVDRLFYPDETAMAAIELDVRSPWTAPTALARSGSVAAGAARRSRTFLIATPLDGTLRVTLRPPARSALRLTVSAPSGAVLARAGAGTGSVQTTVCGQRAVVIRVDRVRGKGAFRLTVSRP